MYSLYYDEITGQFFVGNDIDINYKLEALRRKISKSRNKIFFLNDYCKALGIPDEDPFDNYKISLINYDIPYLFQIDYSMCFGVPAWRITLMG